MRRWYYGCLAGLLCSSATAEIVWWRTQGAAVVQADRLCSLYIYNATQAAIVAWTKEGPQSIAFNDQRQHFENQSLLVMVRIGDAKSITDVASGNGSMVTMPITESDETIRNLLQTATQISGSIPPDYEITITLNRQRMPALLMAVDKCRAVLR